MRPAPEPSPFTDMVHSLRRSVSSVCQENISEAQQTGSRTRQFPNSRLVIAIVEKTQLAPLSPRCPIWWRHSAPPHFTDCSRQLRRKWKLRLWKWTYSRLTFAGNVQLRRLPGLRSGVAASHRLDSARGAYAGLVTVRRDAPIYFTSGRGSGTKPFRLGIFTRGSVASFSSASLSRIPFRYSTNAVTAYV
jgi:hypothetical protein